MPSYAFIWQDNLTKARRVKEAAWVGHAALNIGEHFSLGMDNGRSNYVSWWPSKAAKFSWAGLLASYAKVYSVEAGTQPSLPADIVSEKYLPDHIVRLPSNHEREGEMLGAWDAVLSSRRGSYNNIWENCSTMVATILKSAGLLTANRKVWTPTVLHEVLLQTPGMECMKWIDAVPMLERGGEIVVRKHIVIGHARSGAYCTTGAPVLYQPDQTWGPKEGKKVK